MNKQKLTALILISALSLCAVTGCGPKDDNTEDDILSSYSVDVDLPFATQQASSAQPVATAKLTNVSGWNGETISLTHGEYTALTLGSIGTKVKNLQKRLIELGYMTGTASGTYDQATVQGVKLFQASYGQTQSGNADEVLQYYLYSDNVRQYNAQAVVTSIATEATYRKLQRGDSGSDVIRLQARLVELGYMASTTGTYFDSSTENAVKAFESAYGKSLTGVATVALQEVLFSAGAYSAGSVTPTATPTSQTYSEYSQLSKGDKGTEVKKLQNRLRELGYMSAKADGVYGDKTAEAIKKLEAAYGNEQTGIATVALQEFVFSDSVQPYGEVTVTASPTATAASQDGYRTLSYGSYGDEVTALQKRLKQLGYLDGTIDGYYGNETAGAVSKFESYHGYTKTGVATAALQKYLYSENAKSYGGSTTSDTYSRLEIGSYGDGVTSLQIRLTELGYFSDTVTGYFNDSTASAVKAFEAAYGRTQTGIATSTLQTELYSAEAKTNPNKTAEETYDELSYGSKGDSVARLQSRLIELGYLSGTVDGVYGKGTEEAIKGFEKAYNRTQTGIATAALQSILYSDSAVRNTNGEVAVSYATMQYGASGDSVTRLQNRLRALGFMTDEANGQYDYITKAAVSAYQTKAGYVATGIATSDLQREIFSSSAVSASNEPIVTVNKTAKVTADTAYVYSDMYSDSPMGSVKNGTVLTVLRTKGDWAEVENSSGSTGYMALIALEYIEEEQSSSEVVKVNALAFISVDSAVIYKSASASSKTLGTLSKDTYVTWLRTRGDWAEIENSKGETGYCYVWQLTLYSDKTDVNSYSELSAGCTGKEVKNLQRRLKELGYFDGDIGGNYLSKTAAAVKQAQYALGMEQNGIATIGLQDVLFSKLAPEFAEKEIEQRDYTDMYLGRNDDAVSDFQLELIALGFLSADEVSFGTYDLATCQAVAAVQQKAQMQAQDGIATAELQAALHIYYTKNR